MEDLHLEKCLFGKHEVDIPETLIEDVHLFTQIFSQQTWESVLTGSQRKHLMSFLPNFPASVDEVEKQDTLRLLFNGNTFKFGSPVKQFYKKMRDGVFVPDIAKYAALCSKAREREYRYQQKVYYSGLLREVLINRCRILEALHHLPPEETVKFDSICWNQKSRLEKTHVDYRVNHKCHQLLHEVNEECGQTAVSSSSDDDEDFGCQVSIKSQPKFQLIRTRETKLTTAPVQDTFAPRPTCDLATSVSFQHVASQSVLKQKRPYRKMMMPDISRDCYKAMLHKHKRRKLEYPGHPELNTTHLTLEDIIARVRAAKKTKSFGIHNRKSRKSIPVDGDIDIDVAQYDKEQTSLNVDSNNLQNIKQETEEAVDVIRTATPPQGHTTFPHFFSLLKEFICEEPEEKIMTCKVEDKVRDWQCSDFATANFWHNDRNWTDLVPSALKFLSGDLLGLTLENFVPILDFKERLQLWRWIGHGRDSDDELAVLCDFWSTNRQNEMLDSTASLVPPPRMWTEYKVKPTTDEEKLFFQSQERERFNNPHKAFTYRMHGYEAVVGPVKGVFDKESSIRPRDHALLVKDRPSYVTILTLVHDGAARLPNGEGTRADICELLKDSQFLAPGVTDTQINAVVSGALDRLHYEKDPCVKYDGARKVWIYRHRSRAEDEFERIHQAQCVAAKAKKKALQKSKPFKAVTPRAKEKGIELENCDAPNVAMFSQSIVTSVEMPVNNDYLLAQSLAVGSPFTGTFAKSSSITSHPSASSASSVLQSSVLSAATGPKASTLPSSYKVAETLRAVTCSKGKPFTISLVQQEQRLKSPSVASKFQQSKQLATLSLLQSQLTKASDSAAAVTRPLILTSSSLWSRTTIPPSLTSVGLRLPSESTSSTTFITNSKPVASQIVMSSTPDLRQQLPGVLALSGNVVRSIGIKPAVLTTSSGLAISTPSHFETGTSSVRSSSETGVVTMSKSPADVQPTISLSGQLQPIVVGGKAPSTIAGRSVQFIGRPMQLIQSMKSTAQTGQMLASTANPIHVGSSSPVVIRTRLTSSPSLVSQILQQQQQSLSSSGFPQRLIGAAAVEQSQARSVVASQLRVGSAAQMRLMSSLSQARLVLPADQSGIVITQLPSQTSIMGTQMLIQQRGVRAEVTKQVPVSGARCTIFGPVSKPNSNLQLVRALSSLSADKNKQSSPQPTTYVLATQHVASSSESGIRLQFAASNVTAASAKPSPVFARCIINPAAGLRLSTIVPSQLTATVRPSVYVATCSSLTTATVSSISDAGTDVTKPSN